MKVRCYRQSQEATDELQRELNVRARCFPRWVEDGRVSRTDAQDRLDRLASCLLLLEVLMAAPDKCTVAEYWHEVDRKRAELAAVAEPVPVQVKPNR